ncbi:MAG: type IV pilus twitching motility protein PilT [Thermodesulfovibrionales bacterium]|nr:type IV pilus twitching motility protein PilT [Thermodesulfovibrionales bacterium]
MKIDFLLQQLVDKKGSDLHLKVGRPPLMRINGELLPSEHPVISKKDIEELLLPLLNELQLNRLEKERDIDFSYLINGVGRFRGNIFFQMGTLGGVFRYIPFQIKTIDDLGLPLVLKDIASQNQGLVLVTGPTGCGKSTTLAAIIQYINERFNRHIITIEDPIEFVHSDIKCTINQREIGNDARTFTEAVKKAMRQDPDVILIGEMRDNETINMALRASETGHLVFSTLHTTYAKQSINRIIDAFPLEDQQYIRIRTAMTLRAVIAQKLVVKADGSGRIAVMEIMLNTPTIKKLIAEDKLDHIDQVIAESKKLFKMQTLNQHLFDYVKQGIITKEEALANSNNPNDLKIMFNTLLAEFPKEKEIPPKPPWFEKTKF